MSTLRPFITAVFTFLVLSSSAAGQDKGLFTALGLRKDSVGDLRYNLLENDVHQFITTGRDPFVLTRPLTDRLPDQHVVLSFEYFCPKGLDHLQVWFGPPLEQEHSKLVRKIGMAEGWVSYALDLSGDMGDWGAPGDFLRLDLGNQPDVNLQVRKLRLRPMTDRELEMAATRKEKQMQDAIMHEHLKAYLAADFASSIDKVTVANDRIIVAGTVETTDGIYLCEVPPYMDVTEENEFGSAVSITESRFSVSLDRFEDRDGIRYDRLLSRWVLARKSADGCKLISHARYPDEVTSAYNLPDEKPASRKGLGGFSTRRGHVEDLEDLDITSATVNIWFTRFMHTRPAPDRIEHSYSGKSYYFEKEAVDGFDATFRTTAERNIVVAAILLVDKQERCPDPEIGRLLQHPDMDPAGIYSMPNMTTPESVDCYAAALDFLASRYSRPDKKYGRIHHWIMHNEVDAGWVWTNMGEKTDLVFMDAYLKSMRMCYYIARKYNPHAEVFISLTHYWAWTSHPNFYPSKDLMEILLDYTRAEGDFKWGVAHHPYPESLFEPKTWLDQKVQFDFNTPLITFKNIEVINAWIKLPEALYQGKQKRTLWLSENGTNSPTYSEQDLREQAAGFAYTWKKLRTLDGIDGFQWHNWFDSRGEGGLRIGLRRFPDDEEDPGGRKPVWYVYQAADEENEDEVFEPYKEVIGIRDWDQLIYFGNIDQKQKHASARNIMSDTWVSTDALGRKLPDYGQCGPVKGNRYVGMFYFMTHRQPGGPGPFDVTKIKAANPENPQWGEGSHYWGEPEIGYYLNTDPWAIRRHAYQLADAGVDVIIFDVTNNETFPDVYLPVCEIWREMRAGGERTPDIAFLGSEISVNTLWDEFYEKGMYPDLWFYWKGKPLLLYGQHEQPQRNKVNDIVFREDILNFFSLRQSWAWTSLPWYDDGHDEWPWVDHFPQAIGWHEDPNVAENVPVAVGQHPLSNIGRSFHHFHQPETDIYDLTPLTDWGMNFQEQWDRAIEVDPEFVFVTGWNEWTAGAQVMKEPVIPNLLKWDFYPGAQLGRAGKEIKVGDRYFIDQYNQEYSRDIEPMVGGHTDNYYYQLIGNVRKYKGVQQPPGAGEMISIDLSAGFGQWEKVPSVYYDHLGDIAHRKHPGQGHAGPYINHTGRNDIVASKIARDGEHVYFYVKTAGDITPHTDPNWMLLFIDADQKSETGWEGYDYLVNSEVVSDQVTTLKAWGKRGWGKATSIAYACSGKEMMIEIPRELLGQGPLAIDFHWADNIQELADITEFFLNGDNAPERRSNYRYEE